MIWFPLRKSVGWKLFQIDATAMKIYAYCCCRGKSKLKCHTFDWNWCKCVVLFGRVFFYRNDVRKYCERTVYLPHNLCEKPSQIVHIARIEVSFTIEFTVYRQKTTHHSRHLANLVYVKFSQYHGNDNLCFYHCFHRLQCVRLLFFFSLSFGRPIFDFIFTFASDNLKFALAR